MTALDVVIKAARERAGALRNIAENLYGAGGLSANSPAKGVDAYRARRLAEAEAIEAAIEEVAR